MDNKIEKLIALAGISHRYQYLLLFIIFFTWCNVSFVPIALPFLEKVPEVSFTDNSTGEIIHTQMNYTICKWKNNTYTISQTYEYSWVIELGIYCNEILTGLIGTMAYTGTLIGCLIIPIIADLLGRRVALLLTIGAYALCSLGMALSHNYVLIVLLTACCQLFCNFIWVVSFMILMEVTSDSKRPIFGAIINSGYSFCAVIYICGFLYLQKWRILFLSNAGIMLILLLLFFFLAKESARYFISKGNLNASLKVLEEISSMNNLHESFHNKIKEDEYRQIIHELSSNDLTHPKKNSPEKITWCTLIKYQSIRTQFLILNFLWFCNITNYTGISLFLKYLPGDMYLNGCLIYIFEAISYFFTAWLINTSLFGRKKTLIMYYIIPSLLFGAIFIIRMKGYFIIALILIIRFCYAGVYTAFYTFTFEIYPTAVRSLGFGINLALGNIGGVLVPFLVELLEADYLNLIFALSNFCCCGFMLCMPETFGRTLPETVKEIEEKVAPFDKDYFEDQKI